MRTHTKEQPFACQSCKRRFTLKHSMVRHIAKKHGGGGAGGHDHYEPRSRSSSPPVPASGGGGGMSYDDRRNNNRGGTDTGLIGTLLGIRDNTVIDQVLQTKSPEDAAKMLGICKNNN